MFTLSTYCAIIFLTCINIERVYLLLKDNYHHGDLKTEMIKKGLQLLNKEGYEGFSLRKVAVLCGVSHAAPYKHFKSKEELLAAIVQEVSQNFSSALEEAVHKYPDEPENQIIELGKCYVRFMVENPDYLKFIFLSPNNKSINMVHEYECNNDPYNVFKKSAVNFLESVNASVENRAVDLLTMWCLVHGYSMLLVNNSIEFSQDYLGIVDKMLREKLRF